MNLLPEHIKPEIEQVIRLSKAVNKMSGELTAYDFYREKAFNLKEEEIIKYEEMDRLAGEMLNEIKETLSELREDFPNEYRHFCIRQFQRFKKLLDILNDPTGPASQLSDRYAKRKLIGKLLDGWRDLSENQAPSYAVNWYYAMIDTDKEWFE